MQFKIGDVVLACGGKAIVTDRLLSEKDGTYSYSIRYDGHADEQDDLYMEDELLPYVEEKVSYEIKLELVDNVACFTAIEIKGENRTVAAVGHGHLLSKDLVGVVQAASWATRKALLDINNGSTQIKKTIKE
jgi:uncharacterized protein YodC (DUF2158 family)